MKISTGLRRKVLQSGWLTAFTNPVIEIRDGTPPASADDDQTGTLYCTITLPTSSYFSAVNDEIVANGSWAGTTGKYGTPTWFRLKNTADTGGISTTLPRLDGTIGKLGDMADMEFERLPLEMAEAVSVGGFTIAVQNAAPHFTVEASAGQHEYGVVAIPATATLAASGTVV